MLLEKVEALLGRVGLVLLVGFERSPLRPFSLDRDRAVEGRSGSETGGVASRGVFDWSGN